MKKKKRNGTRTGSNSSRIKLTRFPLQGPSHKYCNCPVIKKGLRDISLFSPFANTWSCVWNIIREYLNSIFIIVLSYKEMIVLCKTSRFQSHTSRIITGQLLMLGLQSGADLGPHAHNTFLNTAVLQSHHMVQLRG